MLVHILFGIHGMLNISVCHTLVKVYLPGEENIYGKKQYMAGEIQEA